MKQVILIIALIASSVLVYAQEEKAPKKSPDPKSKMVLRSNTRDQVCTIKDNAHRKQQMHRKQVVINRQQMMNKKRMQQFQQQKMRQQQRSMQNRRVRQQAARQQQQKRRGR